MWTPPSPATATSRQRRADGQSARRETRQDQPRLHRRHDLRHEILSHEISAEMKKSRDCLRTVRGTRTRPRGKEQDPDQSHQEHHQGRKARQLHRAPTDEATRDRRGASMANDSRNARLETRSTRRTFMLRLTRTTCSAPRSWNIDAQRATAHSDPRTSCTDTFENTDINFLTITTGRSSSTALTTRPIKLRRSAVSTALTMRLTGLRRSSVP